MSIIKNKYYFYVYIIWTKKDYQADWATERSRGHRRAQPKQESQIDSQPSNSLIPCKPISRLGRKRQVKRQHPRFSIFQSAKKLAAWPVFRRPACVAFTGSAAEATTECEPEGREGTPKFAGIAVILSDKGIVFEVESKQFCYVVFRRSMRRTRQDEHQSDTPMSSVFYQTGAHVVLR
jgi:hypothetical protein